MPSFYFLTSPKHALLTLLTKSSICEHRSVQLISLMTKSIPHQNNFTHLFPQVHPPKQTHSFSQTLRPTGQQFFPDKMGAKKSSMHMWEQQDLWPGRQGRGPGHSKAGRDLPNQQHSPTASEQAEQVQWLTGLLKGERPQEAFTQLFFTPA